MKVNPDFISNTGKTSLDDCLPPPNKLSKQAFYETTNENEIDIDLNENSRNDSKLKNYMQLATVFNILEPNVRYF